ncbi:MAG: glycosyltransferase family 2 protein [Candidatus Marinimicrobia bacterium]|nr:glycosyltransferase family 2 protein [Candidatus Neomarinimicrobiota bacterium]
MKIYAAIPVMDEPEWLFRCLDALSAQDYTCFEAWICVNQPEEWRNNPDKQQSCSNNRQTLKKLNGYNAVTLNIIDKSSSGCGWTCRASGVGHARKTIMDTICRKAEDNDIIVSLDADTLTEKGYCSSLAKSFGSNGSIAGISVPYFHNLVSDEKINRLILRYEIYLRYYAINLWRIGSPYAPTAIGSAMAFPVWAYRRVGGMPPRRSGEDFYFLQKLQKMGTILSWIPERVYPAARFSKRVLFGTGIALHKASQKGWGAYPIFSPDLFDNIGKTIALFPQLFKKNIETPISPFLREKFHTDDPWDPLRKNHRNIEQFVRACHERFDGLRIFQYLRSNNSGKTCTEEESLLTYLKKHHGNYIQRETGGEIVKKLLFPDINKSWSFENSDIRQIDAVRCIFAEIENSYRCQHSKKLKDNYEKSSK